MAKPVSAIEYAGEPLDGSGVVDQRLVHRRATFSASVSFDRADAIFRFLVEQGFSVTVEQPESRRGNWRIEGEKIEAMNKEVSDCDE